MNGAKWGGEFSSAPTTFTGTRALCKPPPREQGRYSRTAGAVPRNRSQPKNATGQIHGPALPAAHGRRCPDRAGPHPRAHVGSQPRGLLPARSAGPQATTALAGATHRLAGTRSRPAQPAAGRCRRVNSSLECVGSGLFFSENPANPRTPPNFSGGSRHLRSLLTSFVSFI